MAVLGGLILKPTSQIPRDGLVAEYLFSNNYLDTSGNGYNGTNNGTTFTTDRNGTANRAIALDGTAWVQINAAAVALQATSAGTWSAWVKATDATPANNMVPLMFGTGNAANSTLSIDIDTAGKARSVIVDSSGIKWINQTTSQALTDGAWHHWAITATPGIIYIDGIAVTQSFVISTDTTYWFDDFITTSLITTGMIGRFDNSALPNDRHWIGSLDQVRLYDRILTPAEITILANE